MIRVLFVCLGNICRSPMAEALFRDQVKKEGLEHAIEADSAGTGDWHIGKPPHEGTRKILEKYKVDAAGLAARQIKEADLDEFQWIVAMDSQNQADILSLKKGNPDAKVVRLLDYSDLSDKDVPDPYYTGNFEEVYSLLKESCERLLKEISIIHHL
ncbi:protein tyrosine phosphatase [Bacillus sp. OG2]|nr:protein tyrosine phosphatase [Bacillus sp. OG2]